MNKLPELIHMLLSLLEGKAKTVPENPADDPGKAVLLVELDLHKTEFSALRDEILQLIESERQYLNLSLVAFGAGVGLIPFIANQDANIILLLFPLVFHVLLWEMLKSVQSVGVISTYLMTVLIPRVNEILNLLGRETRSVDALGWELYIYPKSMQPSKLISSSLTPTRHWVPVLAIGGMVIAYLLLVRDAGYMPSPFELVLVFVNLILLIWAAVSNVVTIRSISPKAGK